ncbi:MAG: proliferating cell nuclear antigen (pcna) [Nitrososphaerota archaeon]|nr:proliferating cell nuclear antigen (pcna) [Nitrososphaerales archaeon]MDW8045257.1 proliferating cell nuclear antigen (pcna) [Nitrososphaerota archaeon]
MVFTAKTPTPVEWKAIMAAISTLVEEASFEASPNGITFRAMDPSHVALIDLTWPNSAFEKYNCDKEFKFTVRVDDFVKLIKRADSKDSVEISAMDGEALILRLSNGYKREFKIHLIESTYGPTPLPKLSFNVRIVVVGEVFEKILNDISTVSDHVTLETSEKGIVFSGKSERGTAHITLDKGSKDILELEVKEESKATYSLDYLLSITKAMGSISDTLQCEYSSKMPLRLEFKLGEYGGKVHFYLAPRVE